MNISTLLRRLSAVVSLLLLHTALAAQNPTILVESVTADVDDEVAIEVRGIGFDTLVGVQFSLCWDQELLSFVRVDDIVLNGAQNTNFNQSRLDEGRIGYLESDPAVQGFGLPDSALLFRLILAPQTTVASETMINFCDAPVPPRSVGVNMSSPDLDYAMGSGTVLLTGVNDLAIAAEDPRLTVAPNPFRDQAQITVNLDYGGSATVDVLDLSGRLLDRRTVNITPGNTTLPLTADKLPTNGAYVLRLTTSREQLHRKVILQGR